MPSFQDIARKFSAAWPLVLSFSLCTQLVPAQSRLFRLDSSVPALLPGNPLVRNAGDLNNDGRTDVMVRDGDSTTMRVYSGKDSRNLLVFKKANFQVWDFDGVGDFNNDGHDDIAISMSSIGTGNNIDVLVLSGKDGKQLLKLSGSISSEFLGFSLSGAGDVNRDGHDDLIVSAPLLNSATGEVRVYSGKDSKLLYTFKGRFQADLFGGTVNEAGDLNNDGYGDILIGHSAIDANTVGSLCTAYSGKDGKQLHQMVVDRVAGAGFDAIVSKAGDLDKDGHDDFAVGAPAASFLGFRFNGTVKAYSGKTGKELFAVIGLPEDALGISVDGGHDIDKDGYPDLVVGSEGADRGATKNLGAGHVISGRTGKLIMSAFGRGNGVLFGSSVASLGDVDGDGRADFAVAGLDPSTSNQLYADVYSPAKLTLTSDVQRFAVAKANRQNLTIDVGNQFANQRYWLLGSASGTAGIQLGSARLPLTLDDYTALTIQFANATVGSVWFNATRGSLNNDGRATIDLRAGPSTNTSLVGLTLYHAAVVYDRFGNILAVTNPATIAITR